MAIITGIGNCPCDCRVIKAMSNLIDLDSARARKARLGSKIGRLGYKLLITIASLAIVTAVLLAFTSQSDFSFFLVALCVVCYMPAIWWKRDLSILPVTSNSLNDRLSAETLTRLKPGTSLSPQSVWQAISDSWQSHFLTNHLLLPSSIVASSLSTDPADLDQALQVADQLAKHNESPTIESGFIAAGILSTCQPLAGLLAQMKLQVSDIDELANWLGRGLTSVNRSKQSFGGIGRDWSFGFTPLLDRYGLNISLSIAKHGAHFGWLTTSPGVGAIEAAFNNRASAVAIVGPSGIGKTSHVYALAQRLIEGATSRTLAYHQIISLDASFILSNAKGPGSLEAIINNLANEAISAGHIILFLDNASLFFGSGPGSFDASNILLPIIQNRQIEIIMAFNSSDYQRMKASSPSLAGLLTPVVLTEPSEPNVMHILEDTANNFESRHNLLITYDALKTTYRLSGRYNQDDAYPGKAIKLLEQALAHSDHGAVTTQSIERTIEQTSGVKVGSAAPAEADTLLHLEDKIHERMINQTHAVGVVASALRRSRAGVASPNRPIGSFLFLGPTGVGKTELAKSVADVYFGSESNMIRLDMSEYQQPDDVQRLLATGQNEASSLIMSVRQQPFSVVLLDEIEKAHPNILNLLLQLLDEGKLTDGNGKSVSFKDCIIIATSNAGAQEIRERVQSGESLESFESEFEDRLISSGQFKPELINRFDEIVLFRSLEAKELAQVVMLMMKDLNQTLSSQNITVELTEPAVDKIVEVGYDPRLGARPIRHVLQRAVEDSIAQKILQNITKPGDHIVLDVKDLSL
jgi:ATP-dependent Clp protease ATP-binding subunit ClpC